MNNINISVIIPAYNEENFIAATLTRLQQLLSGQCQFEIIVIDNASTDKTGSIVTGFDGVKLISQASAVTVAAARNLGAAQASGDVYCFIDADILITPEWVLALLDFISNEEKLTSTLTGSQCYVAEQPTWLERYWFGQLTKRQPNYINSANVIMAKSIFDDISGFDESLSSCEDVDICRRAGKVGKIVENNYAFKVHHEGYPATVAQFFKREMWHGSGDYSSLKRFMSSVTAIAGLMYLLLWVLMSLSMALYPQMSVAVLIPLIAMPIAVCRYKFKQQGLVEILVNSVITAVYLVARGISFVRRG